jgi:hypothetical protein
MSNRYLLVPDVHAYPGVSNERADWLGQLIVDLKPDVVVNAGDHFDMTSLSSYDKGKRSFVGKSYKADIDVGLEFHERMWAATKAAKKKRPHRIVFEGNHEHRIEPVLDLSPELVGTIGFKDYQFDEYYDEVIRYDGGLPGILERDGILFAHFFPTGISGRPVSGEWPARMLLAKNNKSSVAFHTHTLDFATRKTVAGEYLNCLVAGCYHDHTPDWAGPISKFWRAGVAVLDNVENGNFDFRWISLESMKNEYGKL